MVRGKQYKDGDIAAQPGEHYVAVAVDSDDEYFLLPHDAGHFRHAWALVRKSRPDVAVVEGLRMPSVNVTSVYNAQCCSLFVRPWTLYR